MTPYCLRFAFLLLFCLLGGCDQFIQKSDLELVQKLDKYQKVLDYVNKSDKHILMEAYADKQGKWCLEQEQYIAYRSSYVCASSYYINFLLSKGLSRKDATTWGNVQGFNDTYRSLRLGRDRVDTIFQMTSEAIEDPEFRKNTDPLRVVEFIRRSPVMSNSEYLSVLTSARAGKASILSKLNAGRNP